MGRANPCSNRGKLISNIGGIDTNITLWVPSGTSIDKERQFLKRELAEADSIQDKCVRQSVQRGL